MFISYFTYDISNIFYRYAFAISDEGIIGALLYGNRPEYGVCKSIIRFCFVCLYIYVDISVI